MLRVMLRGMLRGLRVMLRVMLRGLRGMRWLLRGMRWLLRGMLKMNDWRRWCAMNFFKIATYLWTACAAGWVVIGYVSGENISYMVALFCVIIAAWTSSLEE
jgi:hypothetical protein